MAYLKGLDLNHWRPFTKWTELKNSGQYDFLITKATEGVYFKDQTFIPNATKAKEIGFPFGGYHYFRMNASPIAQAKYFYDYAKDYIEFPPIVDVEITFNTGYSISAFQTQLKAFLVECENLFKRKPMIYTAFYFWRDAVGAPIWSKDYQLWVANYVNNPLTGKPMIPPNWTSWIFWQYTSSESFLGGSYDSNFFYGSKEELYKLANKVYTPAPTLDERVTKLEKDMIVVKDKLDL